jgi:predicted membrane channel-forming protein YqfA (hemolysin III family)
MLYSLFPALLLAGAVALALWTDLRFGDSAPAKAVTLVLHLVAAVLAVVVATKAMESADGAGRTLAVISVIAVFLPSLVYLFVSAIWTLKRIQRAVIDR